MRSSLFVSVAACAAISAAADSPVNPLVERYPADVLLYVGWNDGTARPDVGRARPDRRKATLEDGGVIGSCYAGGIDMFSYTPLESETRIIDTSKPGSIAVWVKYLEERGPIMKTNGKWEPGFGILTVSGKDGQALFLMKSSDCRWGGGTIKVHHQGRDAAGKTISGGACGARSPFVEWRPGEWRFVVAGWTTGSLRISIDGAPFRETPLKTSLGEIGTRMFLRADRRTRLDELVVLGRALSDAEVKEAYESFLKGGKGPEGGKVAEGRLETRLWQARIDAASSAGGGTVVMPAGRHLTGSLFLKSNVTLCLERGCVLEGSTNIADYADIHLEYAEIREPWQALVAAEGQTNIAVVGEGEIFGNGGGFPFDTRLGRPRGMLFHRCRGVRVEGVTMRDLASWTCYYKECDGVVHRRVRVDSHANGNADGVDIESRNVLVEDCEFDCDDDGVVLKSDNPHFIVENVEVRRCEVRSACSLFKLGTASHGGFRNVLFRDCTGGAVRRELVNPKTGNGYLSDYRAETWPGATVKPAPISAIAVEGVDGGLLENITFRNIEAREATCPIFIRGGLRYGRKWGSKVDLGIPFGTARTVRGVTLENVRVKAKSFTASSITGVPGLRLRDITLRNVEIEAPGAGDAALSERGRPVPEKADAYPESNMFDNRMLPAYGFYLRHADNVKFENVRVKLLSPDPRKETVAEDVTWARKRP